MVKSLLKGDVKLDLPRPQICCVGTFARIVFLDTSFEVSSMAYVPFTRF